MVLLHTHKIIILVPLCLCCLEFVPSMLLFNPPYPLLHCLNQLYGIDMLYVLAALARTVGHLSKSTEVMKLVNNLMKAPEMAITMHEFTKEITKVRYLKVLFGWLLEVITPP